MPENDVRTRTSPSPGSATETATTSTPRGAVNTTASAVAAGVVSGVIAPILAAMQSADVNAGAGEAREVARVALPTRWGVFEARAFECRSGFVYLALVLGDVAARHDVLTRVHSECLTGDALGSLRCDCGVQLRLALRAISANGSGVLVYATGHEGRGIGLVNKLRAYVEQDQGADTLDANLRLGLVVDGRTYGDAAEVLRALDVGSIRLLTNNPHKVVALEDAGIVVVSEPLATAPHARNLGYLRAKQERLGHVRPAGPPVRELDGDDDLPEAVDATALVGRVRPRADRPYVVLKFAQTLDGRIATSTGDAKWISGEDERRVSHAMRAACDAVLVGVGTVLQDDPQLTVRMVPGASPVRVVLDSTLRIPEDAKLLGGDALTIIVTTDRSDPGRRAVLRGRGVRVEVVPSGPDGVDLAAALAVIRTSGIDSLLVEGGGEVITSMLAARVVDRVVVGVASTIIGRGTDAVGSLGVTRVRDGVRLVDRAVHVLGDDVLMAWNVEP
jgi:3,4-dihydroxy 2-butanone 4-phosphate synthase/GTP cyclohydrolase II